MSNDPLAHAVTAEGLTISPALDWVVEASQIPEIKVSIDRRVVAMSALAVGIGVCAALLAEALVKLIALITNLSFYGTLSFASSSPAENQLGLWVVAIPMVGGLIVGLMARYGSQAIRGHGIPEAMEQVLTNRSRIPARLMFLKPASAAVAIGTGGPFGAEGPIIATGGALGSVVGQFLRTTPAERKTLLAVGAAAGMAATFGSPVAAVLLAIELLLFEFRARSIVPVALGSATAAGMRLLFHGPHPVFAMTDLAAPGSTALVFYVALGAAMGVAAAWVTRLLYGIEDLFERLPIHWMWWPVLGAAVVGIVGYFAPRTLGVGYDNISGLLSNRWTIQAVAVLCVMKLISWSVALGSGTSGGTLAPMFTIGGGLGAMLGAAANAVVPAAAIDVRIAALVGMAALFAGASRALLASTVFAFETTLQPFGLLPLLGGCTASYLVAALVMKHSLMTEKIARRGVHIPHDYAVDSLEQVLVGQIASRAVVSLTTTQRVGEVQSWLASADGPAAHQGFPVVDPEGKLVGVLTRRDLLQQQLQKEVHLAELITRLPKFVHEDATVRQAADHMVNHNIGRLPVLTRQKPHRLVGIVTRSDILSAFKHRLDESLPEPPTLRIPRLRRRNATR